MIRIAWRSLTSHKLRTILTTLAVLLGVAMISGTYVLTDQIDRGFKQIFTEAYKGTDVTIVRKTSFTADYAGSSKGMPQSTVDDVRAVDGVAEAAGYVSAQAAVAVRGKVVETRGAPALFFSYAPSDVSATSYIQGSPPSKPGDIGVIQKLAKDQKLAIGSPVTVIAQSGAHQARVSGVFQFGAESSLGGSLILQPTLQDAQQWFDMRGLVSEIDVKAEAGTSAETLAARIRSALPAYVDVKTGAQAVADQTKQVSDAIGAFLTPALLSFGGIAVLVGAFIIFNAFSMTVAQRRREFAMLRALGASGRQVLASVAGEALLTGVLASLLGLFAGLGVAAGINALFKAIGADFPHSGLVLAPRTIVLALGVGIVVTLLSAVIPAARAMRVPPVAALQEGATLPPSRFARFTPYFAVALAVLGAVMIVAGMYGPGTTTTRLGTIAVGAVVVFVAVAIASKYLVRPVARALGWPLQKLSPVSGRLARDNSARNPARTAATASALMIGLGVVVFVAVFAQGLKSSFIDSFDNTVRAQYIVTGSNYLALPSESLARVQSVPGVQNAAGLSMQMVQVDKKLTSAMGLDPYDFARVWHFDWLGGASDKLLLRLGTDKAVVEKDTASSLGLTVGKRFTMVNADGDKATYEVVGEYRDPTMLTGIAVSDAGFRRIAPPATAVQGVRLGHAGRERTTDPAGRQGVPRRPAHRRGADRGGVQGHDHQPGEPAADHAVRAAGDERSHLALRHRQYPGAGGVRADPRDRPQPCDRYVPPPGAGHGALRERDHVHHRRPHGHRRGHRVRLGRDHEVRRGGHHVLDPRRAARHLPGGRRDRGRPGRHPAGQESGPYRHPAGHPVRVTDEGGAPQARAPCTLFQSSRI